MHKNTLHVYKPALQEDVLTCTYFFGSETFSNRYRFPAVPEIPSSPLTEKLCQWVAIVTAFGLFSVEYFDILACDFGITASEAKFFEKIIFLGFGEFRYVNGIELNKKTALKGKGEPMSIHTQPTPGGKGALLLNGGGKDGSVSAYLLSQAKIPFTWFQRGRSAAQSNVTEAWDHPVFTVERTLDPKRSNRKYRGHRPMSAGIAFIALLAAHLFGYTEIIASNEASADEGNITKEGLTINHQYSKSLEFEQDIQELLSSFKVGVQYFSLLRPLYEIQIAQLATRLSANQLSAIVSCNNGTREGKWCMACAKCAFVVLVITAFSTKSAEKIWGNEHAINNISLRPYFVELLDPNVDKPFECVGMLPECQLAAHMIVANHSEILDKPTREILESYASMRDISQDEIILSHRGPSAIPDRFQPAISAI